MLLLFSCPVVSDSLRPHGLPYDRPLCPSPSPEVLPKFMSIASSHPAISSSDAFFCPQSFLASDIYPMSQLFTSDKQNTGASAIINSSSNKYLELIFFKIDWFHLLAMQGTLRSLLQYQSLKASIL